MSGIAPMPLSSRRFHVAICFLALVAATQPAAYSQPAAETPPPAAPQPKIPGGEAGPAQETPVKPPPASSTETPAVVIDSGAATALLGKPVKSMKDEDLGRVVDVIVDRNGMMRAAIIDFGGFLGVGMRKIAVDWRALHFPDKGGMGKLIADLSRDQLRMAPVYKEGEPVVVIGGTAPDTVAPAAKN